jgi:hypothetical protein
VTPHRCRLRLAIWSNHCGRRGNEPSRNFQLARPVSLQADCGPLSRRVGCRSAGAARPARELPHLLSPTGFHGLVEVLRAWSPLWRKTQSCAGDRNGPSGYGSSRSGWRRWSGWLAWPGRRFGWLNLRCPELGFNPLQRLGYRAKKSSPAWRRSGSKMSIRKRSDAARARFDEESVGRRRLAPTNMET